MNFSIQTESRCCICGSERFKPGFNGRLSYNRPPECEGCGSTERHRALRQVYGIIGPKYFEARNCIQFSSDPSVPRNWFKDFVASEYGGRNSQDICDITIEDESFDWVVCNHVLEHIENDTLALKELLRITRPNGVVQISFPMPHFLPRTIDWGYPKEEDHGHYRHYGADVIDRLIRPAGARSCLAVVGGDSATGVWENAYFLGHSIDAVQEICEPLIRKNPAFMVAFEKR